jgi:hypothetical protein
VDAGTIEGWTDLPALALDGVTGAAKAVEDGPAAADISRLRGEPAEVVEACEEACGFLFGLNRRQVADGQTAVDPPLQAFAVCTIIGAL